MIILICGIAWFHHPESYKNDAGTIISVGWDAMDRG